MRVMCNNHMMYVYIFIDKGLQIRATEIFLQIRAFTEKGPIIITDKAFLHIRASHTLRERKFIAYTVHTSECRPQPLLSAPAVT